VQDVSNTDPYSRRAVYVVAVLLAAWAFIVSYSHIYDLGLAHAQHGIAAKGMPLTVDLLIVAASLVVWMQKREDVRPTGLARFLPRLMLWSGIGATVAANIAYGLPSGWESGALSAWPGAVFAGVVEMVMVTVRPTQREAVKQTVKTAGQAPVPASSYDAAVAAYAASADGPNPLTDWQLHTRFSIPRSKARKIVASAAPQTPAGTAVPSPAQTVRAGPSPVMSTQNGAGQ
jgi:hypothetical protein